MDLFEARLFKESVVKRSSFYDKTLKNHHASCFYKETYYEREGKAARLCYVVIWTPYNCLLATC